MKRACFVIGLLILMLPSFGQQSNAIVDTFEFPKNLSLPSRLFNLHAAYNGEIFMYLDNSVYTKNKENWRILSRFSKQSDTTVNAIVYGNDAFYFGTSKGLAIKKGAIWEDINSTNSNLASDDIQYIFANNEIVIVVTNTGLSYKKSDVEKWVNFSESQLKSDKYSGYQMPQIQYLNNKIFYINRYRNDSLNIINTANNSIHKDIPMLSMATLNNKIVTNSQVTFKDTDIVNLTSNECSNFKYGIEPILIDQNQNAITIINPFQIFFSIYHLGQLYTILFNEPFKLHSTKYFYDLKTDTLYFPNERIKFKVSDLVKLAVERHDMLVVNTNKMRIPIMNDGYLNTDRINHSSFFQAPTNYCFNPGLASALWLSAYAADSLCTAFVEWNELNSDFTPGPLNKITGQPIASEFDRCNRLWLVNRKDIENHLRLVNQNGYVQDELIPESIRNWPGNYLENPIDILAPFFDRNGNNQYEPNLGDYPAIKGNQAVFWIMNDIHSMTSTNHLGIEIHGMAYTEECANEDAKLNELLSTSIFFNYTLHNRSNNDLKDAIVGMHNQSTFSHSNSEGANVQLNAVYNHPYQLDTSNYLSTYQPIIGHFIAQAPNYKLHGSNDTVLLGSNIILKNYLADHSFRQPKNAIEIRNFMEGKNKYGLPIIFPDSSKDSSFITTYMHSAGTDINYPNSSWPLTTQQACNSLISTFKFDIPKHQNKTVEFGQFLSMYNSDYSDLSKFFNELKSISKRQKAPCETKTKLNDDKIQLINVYPNPFQGHFTLTTNQPITGKVAILDLLGKTISEIAIVNQYEISFENLAYLKSGLYLIRIENQGHIHTFKLVKQEYFY